MLVLLLSPFALAPFMPALGARLGAKTGWFALLAPIASFVAALQLHALPPEARAVAVVWEWIPSLGANLSFTADGLAMLYALIVSGVGMLVVFYAACYLDDHHYRDHGKFYCYLLLFMGSMLVTVMSSNLLVLFVAWELTGITSFLLIGFLHDKAESQRGARMALLTTGLTGLVLLAGVVLLRVAYGTFDLAEIIAAGGVAAGNEALLGAAFLCCFVGIAGKSAQFPFHYWLPNAMAAPTPVSAYLHSATMVKLGVFLTARLLPVFNGLDTWMPLLTGIGFGTMLLGAVLALLSQDLKGVLAYTTVAQLGLLIGYYGLHEQGVAVPWDALHILNHVFYKACLFMVVGIIDHCTGTRDLRKLGGLWQKMPLVGTAAIFALAAFAGLPPTTGFLSKEMLLADLYELYHAQGGLQGLWPLATVALASAINIAVAARILFGAFLGKPTHAVEAHFHAPSLGLQAPAVLLGAMTMIGGLGAAAFGRLTLGFGNSAGRTAVGPELHLWHGITPELITSTIITVAGLALFFAVGRARWDRVAIPRWLRFDLGFDKIADGVPYAARAFNRALGFETPYAYLYVVCAVMAAVPAWFLLPNWDALTAHASRWDLLPSASAGWLRWVVVAVICAAAICAAAWKRVIPQLFALSIIGLGIVFYYVLYQGPDLAITQMLVESATLILVLLVVLRLKRDGADTEALPRQGGVPVALRIALGVAGGLLMGGSVLIFQQPREGAGDWAGDYYLANSLANAKGANAVNTTVIDFRGYDTMFEICVLVIATLGCLGLISRRCSAPPRGVGRGQTDLFPVPKDFILRMIAIGGFVPLNLFALHVFLRGHNEPGGGFPAGLITALSLILLVFVLGVHGVRRLVRINPLGLAVVGVFFALGSALLPPFFQGLPVLHHFHVYLG
ncbi:MAG: DUF4040 domain-containing protein, partial [Burkholderiales bacterium]|nr:DUF4040 domain-containing protein [Opitutaceae bacterium]